MSAQYLKDVGKNLREARRRAGLRQKEVEARSGIAYRHYQDIEAGKVNIRIATLCRLASAFGTSVTTLTRGCC